MSRQEFLLPFHYQVPKEGAYQEVRRKLYAAIKPAKYDFVRLSDISLERLPDRRWMRSCFCLWQKERS